MANAEILYFEDIEVGGEPCISPGRTITVADITNFAGVSGDFSEPHVNHDLMNGAARGSQFAAAAELFQGPIAHGLLGLIVQDALVSRVMPRTAGMAFLGINWRFRGPIRPGDTLYVRFWLKDKRLSTSRPGTGILTWGREVFNQNDEVVQEGEQLVLVQCRADQ